MMRILLATDGSANAAAARDFLAALPLPAGSAVRVVMVVHPAWIPVGPLGDVPYASWSTLREVEEAVEAFAARQVSETSVALSRPGVELTTEIRHGSPAPEILAAAQSFAADVIAVGAQGLTGIGRFLLGSVAHSVTHHAPCPVLVGRPLRHGLRQAILAVDESECAAHAGEFFARLPLPPETRVLATHVVRPYHLPFRLEMESGAAERLERELLDRRRAEAGELLRRAAAVFVPAGLLVSTEIAEGDPADSILELARQREADLIVAGARGASLLERLLVGSVADRLLSHAECSVLIVR